MTKIVDREPRAAGWTVQFRQFVNRRATRLIGRAPFALTVRELFGPAPQWQQRLSRWWNRIVRETNFFYAICLFVLCSVVTYAWWRWDPASKLWPEMGGMALNVLFITIIFAVFESRRERLQFENRQQEIIDDYKRWDAPDARLRIAGAVRRLNRSGRTDIAFSGLQLSEFDFAAAGIGDLSGSVFYDGMWGEPLKDHAIYLRKVSFDHVNCASVVFSAMNPLSGLRTMISPFAVLEDCTFVHANLRNARFSGATLKWSEAPPPSHYEFSTDDEGEEYSAQISYGPFDGAELEGASFSDCDLENADFRGADGVDKADFTGAQGLDKALFDDDETRATVLQMASQKEADHRISPSPRSR